jgi:hypothetical protein
MANNYALTASGHCYNLDDGGVPPAGRDVVVVRHYRNADRVEKMLSTGWSLRMIKRLVCADCLCFRDQHRLTTDGWCRAFRPQSSNAVQLYYVRV